MIAIKGDLVDVREQKVAEPFHFQEGAAFAGLWNSTSDRIVESFDGGHRRRAPSE